nr:MAG TPA: Vpu protein [Caudoviricetes sp.]
MCLIFFWTISYSGTIYKSFIKSYNINKLTKRIKNG